MLFVSSKIQNIQDFVGRNIWLQTVLINCTVQKNPLAEDDYPCEKPLQSLVLEIQMRNLFFLNICIFKLSF